MDTLGPDLSPGLDRGFDYFASLIFNRPRFGVKEFTRRLPMPTRLELAHDNFAGLAIEDLPGGAQGLCLFARGELEAAQGALESLARAEHFEFPVAVRRTGRIVPAQRRRPAMGGDSIGHFRGATGTLGCTVTDEAGQALILSCNHVLADLNCGARGDDIVQPGTGPGGQAGDRIGELTRFLPLVLDGQTPNLVDGALASVDVDGTVHDGIRPIGPLAGPQPAPPPRRAPVFKQGAATQWTVGRITFRRAEVVLSYDRHHVDVVMANHYGIIGTSGPFAAQGDSGAIVVDEMSQAVAMVIGVTEDPSSSVTFATPIEQVLASLQVTLR